jgi:hypothetical protein
MNCMWQSCLCPISELVSHSNSGRPSAISWSSHRFAMSAPTNWTHIHDIIGMRRIAFIVVNYHTIARQAWVVKTASSVVPSPNSRRVRWRQPLIVLSRPISCRPTKRRHESRPYLGASVNHHDRHPELPNIWSTCGCPLPAVTLQPDTGSLGHLSESTEHTHLHQI